MLSLFCDLFVMMGSITLWTCAHSFAQQLQDEMLQQTDDDNAFILMSRKLKTDSQLGAYDTVHNNYLALKKFTSLINSMFDSNVTCFLLDAVLYYSTSFNEVFIEGVGFTDWNKSFRVLFFFCNMCIALLISAEIVHCMQALKDWLVFAVLNPAGRQLFQRKELAIPLEEIHIYINDLASDVISMKGSDVFSITYSLLANVS